MSPLLFYRQQAAQQQAAADAATLQNVRERCQRASDAWAALALRSERADAARLQAAADKLTEELSPNADRGSPAIEQL
jgi:hypothetical protein